MSAGDALLLGATGLVAGLANTVAGGGSLLAVPLLIFLGIPATTANATTRPAIVAQNLLAIAGFRRAGVYADRVFTASTIILALCALPGAALGAFLAASRIDDPLFERLLSVVLIAVAVLTWRRGRGRSEADVDAPRRPGRAALSFVAIGFYGGFIQAGVGFLIMAALVHSAPWGLARVNAAKVVIVLAYTIIALATYAAHDKIAWAPAAALLAGQSLGGFLGSQVSLRSSDTVLMRVYVLLLIIFAISLAL